MILLLHIVYIKKKFSKYIVNRDIKSQLNSHSLFIFFLWNQLKVSFVVFLEL